MSNRVCDCPEPCACYAEGYAQSKDKAYFEMNNFDWTQHAKVVHAKAGPPSARSW